MFAKTSLSNAGVSLQPHPPPCENWVRRRAAGSMDVFMIQVEKECSGMLRNVHGMRRR
jgi:hypothetical protein